MKPLNARQRQFAQEYLIDLNGRRAAMRAGYSASQSSKTSTELLRRPDIAALVAAGQAARSARTGIAQDFVLTQLAAIAGADLWDACDWGVRDGKPFVEPRDPLALSAETHRAVAEITVTTTGARVKMHDKMAALTALCRHLGMFRDAPAAGPGEGEAGVAALAQALSFLSPTARAEMRAALTGEAMAATGGEGR